MLEVVMQKTAGMSIAVVLLCQLSPEAMHAALGSMNLLALRESVKLFCRARGMGE